MTFSKGDVNHKLANVLQEPPIFASIAITELKTKPEVISIPLWSLFQFLLPDFCLEILPLLSG